MSRPVTSWLMWGRWSAPWRRLAILSVLLLATPVTAHAVSCSAATGPTSFPNYESGASLPTDSSGGYVEMRCTCSGLDCIVFGYSIEIQAGGSGDVSDRKMTRAGGSETLRYSLYRDVTRLLPWGTGVNGLGGLYLLNQFGAWQRTYVHGRIPAGQVVPSGSYSDAPAVVVSF